jgi:hypothetical protein
MSEHFHNQICAHCKQRRGLHRYGDEACPNTHWKTGNGRPQWLEAWSFTPMSYSMREHQERVQAVIGQEPAA